MGKAFRHKSKKNPQSKDQINLQHKNYFKKHKNN